MGYLASWLVAAIAVSTVGATSFPPSYYCSSPRAPHHGGYRSSSGYGSSYLAGNVINYFCDDGYQLYGSPESACYYDSRRYSSYWNYPAPSCRAVDCGNLDDPEYGSVDFSSTIFQSKATYSCKKGFTLVGDKTRVCQANGRWSGDMPVCKPVDCGNLDDPEYGSVDFSSTIFQSKATYSCKKGLTLVGDKTRVCQANGRWSGDMPVCKRVDCGDLSNPKYGYVRLTGTRFGSKATYFCSKGSFRLGRKTRVCQSNGKWSGKPPICKRRDCGKLLHPFYGQVKYRCTTYECKAYYKCYYGYHLLGDHSRVCQHRGYWSGHRPVCIRYIKHH